MSPSAAQNSCVLIVDDDADARESLAAVLQSEGYQVATAADGEEGLRFLRKNPHPALILLDLMMPGMNGWSFRAEQQQDPEIASVPVVLLSGMNDVHQQPPALQVDGYLRKPIAINVLLEVVRSYCR